MAKLTLNPITSGYASVAALNENFEAIEDALENTLSRDGSIPNTMSADLDMNSNSILNLSSLAVDSLSINGTPVVPTGTIVAEIPTQSGHTDKFLQTNGTAVSWQIPDAGEISFTQVGTGAATNLFVQDKLQESVSVKDFGAVGDGVTDDTNSIVAALAAVVAFDLEVRPSLYFPAGNYIITSSIEITDDGIQIYGEGNAAPFDSLSTYAGGTKITYDGTALDTSTEGVFMLGTSGNQCRGVAIRNLTIDAATLGNAIFGEQMNSCTIERVTTLQAVWGVYLTGSNNNSNSFVDCIFYDPNTGGGGLQLRENAHSNDIVRCSFANKSTGTRNPAYAVRIAAAGNCSAISIDGCNFDYYRVSSSHIQLVTDCKGFSFTNNYLEAKNDGVTAGGLTFAGGSGLTVTGNRFSTSGASALDYGVNFQATAEGAIVAGNYFSGFATAAVRISSGASNITCIGNHLESGLTHVVNQNAVGSKNAMVETDGDVVTDSVSAEKIKFTQGANLTIASGAITATGSYHRVDTEGAAASDDLDTINGGADGVILVLCSVSNSRDVTVKDATGNIQLAGDFTMLTARDKLVLMYDSTAGVWCELTRSTN